MKNTKTERHHVIPRERRKKQTIPNSSNKILIFGTVRLKIKRHKAWHELFGHYTIDECIELLQRIKIQTLRKVVRNMPKDKRPNEMYFFRA